MATGFSEVVIDGHFILVKGFLMGFWATLEQQPRYFFHRNTGVHQETFRDIIAEYFELGDAVAVCLEDAVVPAFERAVATAKPVIGIDIVSVKKIKAGAFRFAAHAYKPEAGEECKSIFADLPEGVQLVDFSPKETLRDEGKSDPLVHAYEYSAKGRATGDFGGLVDLYLRIKKSRARDVIETKEITIET